MKIPINQRPLARLLWCAIGASVALFFALWVIKLPEAPFLLASLGGSTIFLFGLTRVPAAQPRALFGGHLGGAFIGIACYQIWGDTILVYTTATALTLCFMLLTRTVHPPAGANPIIMIHAHSGWPALWESVFLGIGCLFLVVIVWSRLYPGLAHYPVSFMEPSPPNLNWGGWRRD
ncbi:HPP family protein [Nitrosomonas ureae]|uniref:HPP family protein n=1 Tax=Nitrosomonas ureae TaxID=44577 RepID=UPI001E3609B4|nr:HPP family protein [Nitrosomonas ureae]